MPLRELDRDRLKARLEFLDGSLDTFDDATDGLTLAVYHDFPVLVYIRKVDLFALSSSLELGFAAEDEWDEVLRNVPHALCGLGRFRSDNSGEVTTSFFGERSWAMKRNGDRGFIFLSISRRR